MHPEGYTGDYDDNRVQPLSMLDRQADPAIGWFPSIVFYNTEHGRHPSCVDGLEFVDPRPLAARTPLCLPKESPATPYVEAYAATLAPETRVTIGDLVTRVPGWDGRLFQYSTRPPVATQRDLQEMVDRNGARPGFRLGRMASLYTRSCCAAIGRRLLQQCTTAYATGAAEPPTEVATNEAAEPLFRPPTESEQAALQEVIADIQRQSTSLGRKQVLDAVLRRQPGARVERR